MTRLISRNMIMLSVSDIPLDMPIFRTPVLVRKSSFHSLVEIPTYVTCKIHLKSIASGAESFQPDSETNAGISLVQRLSTYHPIISEETRTIMQQRVMCMATVFCVCCLMMVGTMFAVTSHYQDMIIATMINVSHHQLNTMEEESF
eukprot:GFUD01053136.1.p1 GENE.GFUD01053136.1~~GFUD01053136.1.p1  ORF type:complete len:146 (-),score=31.42 GFUD01053136.1:337-774(-)